MNKNLTITLLCLVLYNINQAQTKLYIPSGTAGILNNTINTYVGIGISNPTAFLHINGNVRGGSTNGTLRINSLSGYVDIGPQSASYCDFKTDRGFFLFDKPVYSSTFGSLSNLTIQTGTAYMLSFNVGTNNILKIDQYSAKVNKSLIVDGVLQLYQTDPSVSSFLIGPNFTYGHVYANYKKNLYFRSDIQNQGLSVMVLESGGNVGIGFNASFNPSQASVTMGYKLAVNGGIICEEVKVISDVPNSDYVFEKDYKLPSLFEVESFVKKNKHLQDIPSAEEFKQNGYKVGEMDDMLLRKVEELTLYIIQLKKEIEQLQAKKNNH